MKRNDQLKEEVFQLLENSNLSEEEKLKLARKVTQLAECNDYLYHALRDAGRNGSTEARGALKRLTLD